MPTTIPKSKQVTERREKFREYMRKLNPVAPARRTIGEGLVLEDLHESLCKTLAARADLDPSSQQLLVGGIGSGKTTTLLLVEQRLKIEGQTLPLYIDISSMTDVSALNLGALLAGFGLQLYTTMVGAGFSPVLDANVKKELEEANKLIWGFAYGTQIKISREQSLARELAFAKSFTSMPIFVTEINDKLKPPLPALQREIQEVIKPLATLIKAARAASLEVVVIFDGLDRLITPNKFWAVVDQDFRALKQLNVAVIAAAPLSVLYGEGRSIGDHFDRIQTIPMLRSDPEKNDSLKALLR